MSKLSVGDIVKAECPVTGAWADASVNQIRSNGLVEVRWHDPGTDPYGRPFQALGDVWAEKVRVAFRREASSQEEGSQPFSQDAEAAVDLPDGLLIGDECFAFGHSAIVEKQWFRAKLLSMHSRNKDQVRVEYVATRDGETVSLALPEPRKAYVPMDHVRREPPSDATEPTTQDAKPEADAETASEKTCAEPGKDDVVVDADLMCTVCGRPDDESLMLICDCKAGYHTYCLTPALDDVPDGDWRCPACAA